MKSHPTRREFINRLTLAAAGSITSSAAFANPMYHPFPLLEPDHKHTICAFSKMFDSLGEDMFAFLAEAGFEGVDLTVRRDGYVLPENVEKELPRAVAAAQKKGLSIPMIATAIDDVSTPVTGKILKTAAELGVKHYRTGYFNYDNRMNTAQNLDNFRKRLSGLCELNARYGIQGCYQNHVGGMFGGPVWDLWTALEGLDARYIGCQYDVRHAVAEGFSSWQLGLRAISPYIGCLCIKDFVYANNNGKWGVKSVPLGDGAVDFKTYFEILKEKNIQGPMSIHYEFPLLEKADEALPAKERMKKMLPAVKKEADTLKILMIN